MNFLSYKTSWILMVLSFTSFVFTWRSCVDPVALSRDLPKGSPSPCWLTARVGCKEQISWELISRNTRRTQLTPCKAFWANTAEWNSHFWPKSSKNKKQKTFCPPPPPKTQRRMLEQPREVLKWVLSSRPAGLGRNDDPLQNLILWSSPVISHTCNSYYI